MKTAAKVRSVLPTKILKAKSKRRKFFLSLKAKLLNINEWNDHSLMSSYALFDENGREINEINVGDFIRISLKVSGKYDWIRVTDIYDAPDEFIIKVKPTFDPTAENADKSAISHFFTDEAANNFCLFKKAKRSRFTSSV